MSFNRRNVGFAAFTAFFAVLAAIVFWGAWSPTSAIIAPDDGLAFTCDYADTIQRWWNNVLSTGKILPTDLVHWGLLGSPLACRELKYAVSVYLAGLALAWFLRGRGLSEFSSYGAGLFLAFSGYWLTLFSAGHAGWFVWMSYGVFAFGLVDRALERGGLRYWLFLALVLAWGSFYQPDLWLLFTVFTAAYFVFRLVASHARPKARDLALSALVFFAVGAPSFHSALVHDLKGRDKQIEAAAVQRKSAGEDNRWIFVTNWSLPPAETLEAVWPRLNGDTSCPFALSINAKKGIRPYCGELGRAYGASTGNYRQHSLYLGFVTCLCALCALFLIPKDKTVVFFVLAALVFWLFSLGRNCESVYRLVYTLPFGDYLRAPVKWYHLVEFCVAVLAGYGIERLKSSRFGLPVACGLILMGTFDLATEARRFCAPVDYSQAIARKCSAQLTVLRRAEFQNPQVASLVRAGYVVSVAKWLGHSDAYLVEVLEPMKRTSPAEPKPLPLALGFLSVLAAASVLVVGRKK